MRGVYRVRETLTTVTTAKQCLYLGLPATMVVELLGATVSSPDFTSGEKLHVKLARATGTVAGGTALTPKPTEELSAASGVTAKSGNTAITGMTPDGDDDAICNKSELIDGGWVYDPVPEMRDVLKPSEQLILETKVTLTSCTLIAEIEYREIG